MTTGLEVIVEMKKGNRDKMCFEVEGNGKGRMNSYFVVVFFLPVKTRKSSSIQP